MATHQYALDIQPVNVNAAMDQYDRGAQTARLRVQDQKVAKQDADNQAMKQYAPGVISGDQQDTKSAMGIDPNATMTLLHNARQLKDDDLKRNAASDAALLNVFQNLADIAKNHPEQYDAAVSQAKPLLLSQGVPEE